MAVNQPEKDFFTAKGFGTTMGFGRRPALIVIDLLYAFTDRASDIALAFFRNGTAVWKIT